MKRTLLYWGLLPAVVVFTLFLILWWRTKDYCGPLPMPSPAYQEVTLDDWMSK